MRAIMLNVSPGNIQALGRCDNYWGSAFACQVVVTAPATFSLKHSFDDVNDLINPLSVAGMFWDNSMFPAGAQSGSASITFNCSTAPLWVQLNLVSGTGSVRATLLQLGVHSRSNILLGKFAPPRLATAQNGAGGNFWATPQ